MKYQKDSRKRRNSVSLQGWEFIGSASPENSERMDDVVSLFEKEGVFALATNGDPIYEGESYGGDELISVLRSMYEV